MAEAGCIGLLRLNLPVFLPEGQCPDRLVTSLEPGSSGVSVQAAQAGQGICLLVSFHGAVQLADQ